MLFKAFIFLLLIFTSVNSTSTYAQYSSTSIRFQDAYWYQILKQAQQENKHIFVVVHADYCLPCRKMERDVFTHPKVATFHNTFFINYNVNLSEQDKKDFIKRHSIEVLPSFFYFDPQGKMVWKTTGEKQVKEMLDLGKRIVLKSAIPIVNNTASKQQSLHELQTQYKAGSRDTSLLVDLAYALRMQHQPHAEIVDQYLQQQTNVKTSKNRSFIYEYANDLESKAIDYLINDIQYFKEYYGPQHVNEKIKNTIYNAVIVAIQRNDKALFTRAQQMIDAAYLPAAHKFKFEINSLYYQSTNDWKAYAKNACQYLQKHPSSDPKLLNHVTRNFCYQVDNGKMLITAIHWIETSIAIENEYYNNETYALLLYKLGQTQQAKQIAEKAIMIAQYRGNNYQIASRLIHTISTAN